MNNDLVTAMTQAIWAQVVQQAKEDMEKKIKPGDYVNVFRTPEDDELGAITWDDDKAEWVNDKLRHKVLAVHEQHDKPCAILEYKEGSEEKGSFPLVILEKLPSLSVGDIVKITRKATREEHTYWTVDQDASVGREFKVLGVTKDAYCTLEDGYLYPEVILEKMVPLKKGDVIRVMRSSVSLNLPGNWYEEHEASLGKKFTVSSAVEDVIQLTNGLSYYRLSVDRVTTVFKRGDIVVPTREWSHDERGDCPAYTKDSHSSVINKEGPIQDTYGRNAYKVHGVWWPMVVLEPGGVTSYKVGDEVAILRKATEEEYAGVGWDRQMDDCVGKVGKITKVATKKTDVYQVDVPGVYHAWYPACVLQLTTKIVPPIQIVYKKGDFIKIIRETTEEESHGIGSAEVMNKSIGRIAKVTNVYEPRTDRLACVGVDLDGNSTQTYAWPTCSIRKAKDWEEKKFGKPASKKKEVTEIV